MNLSFRGSKYRSLSLIRYSKSLYEWSCSVLFQFDNNRRTSLPDNLSWETRKSLQEMKSRKDIVIRKADKGSKFFILDREDYVSRVLVHLEDPSTFFVVSDKEKAIKRVI